MQRVTFLLLAAGLAAGGATAGVPIRITVTGTVTFNLITLPPLSGVPVGAPATMTFEVDSDNYVNSPNFPTRGYIIEQSSFLLDFGAVQIGLQDPFPPGETPYFVIRNNDPAVDGFIVSTDYNGPAGVPINQAHTNGVYYRDNFYVTYAGSTLPSLSILDALGTYGYTGLSTFNWTITRNGFDFVGIDFTQLEIAPLCQGDVNGDGCTNQSDLGIVLGNYGCQACTPAQGDLSGDGKVGQEDLGILLADYGCGGC